MGFESNFLLTIAVFLVSCNTGMATTDLDLTKFTTEIVSASLSTTKFDTYKRHLRSSDTIGEATDLATNWDGENNSADSTFNSIAEEKRPLNGSAVSRGLMAKVMYTWGIERTRWERFLRWIENTMFLHTRLYFRNLYWDFKFTVWLMNKRTPSQMYDRLKVGETTGPLDENYCIYVQYLRFYEHFKGPTYNPLIDLGPKVSTNTVVKSDNFEV